MSNFKNAIENLDTRIVFTSTKIISPMVFLIDGNTWIFYYQPRVKNGKLCLIWQLNILDEFIIGNNIKRYIPLSHFGEYERFFQFTMSQELNCIIEQDDKKVYVKGMEKYNNINYSKAKIVLETDDFINYLKLCENHILASAPEFFAKL